jgi:16S rRNA (guanine527-N7)-methyltransferase
MALDMQLIEKYFGHITEEQRRQYAHLHALYSEWNAKINVISRQDLDNLYERHILHSLAIAKVANFKNGTEILDVGTGGGFPGIPLAIMYPECSFHLIDSIGKKITVVNEVATALGLKNVKAEQIRAEQLHQDYEFIVCRAVTQLPVFFGWVKGKISANHFNGLRNGLLCLKGGDLHAELASLGRRHKVYEISQLFEEEFFNTKKLVHVPI